MTNPALGLLIVVYANIIIWSIVIMAAEAANPAPDENLRVNALRYTDRIEKQPERSAPPIPLPYSKPNGYIDAQEQRILDTLTGRKKK